MYDGAVTPREDPQWPRASHWLAQGRKGSPVTVLGVPINRSVTPGRYDLGPQAIRQALARYSLWPGDGSPLTECWDAGDVVLPEDDADGEVAAIEEAVASLGVGERLVLFGGDNGLTRGAVRGLARARRVALERVGVITLDAHFDLRSTEGGPMNGNPIRGLLEDGLPGRNVVQVGIQPFANSPAYAAVAKDSGIHVVRAEDTSLAEGVVRGLASLAARVDWIYADIDLDVMDRAFAPGCPGSRPGGASPRELLQAVSHLKRHPQVVALDLVELDPSKDINEATALAAARVFLEIVSP